MEEDATEPAGGHRERSSSLYLLRPSELCSLAHSMAVLGHVPSPTWMDSFYAASSEAMAPATAAASGDEAAPGGPVPTLMATPLTPAEFTALVVGLSGMTTAAAAAAAAGGGGGLLSPPGEAWTRSFCAASSPLLMRYSGTELTLTLSSLAVLGSKPGDYWMAGFYAAVLAHLQRQKGEGQLLPEGRQQQMQQMAVEQLTEVVSSLARLSCRPDSAWLNECLMRTNRGLSSMGAKHLAQV